MCGIAGVLTLDAGPAAAAAVERMAGRLAHRGPDGAGHWQSPSPGAIFATTRLAVFDVSPSAAQPMTIDGGRFTITYNGAIYNFQAIRAELERAGARFDTRSDTEVILRAYQAHGAACVERLQGMFAFAIWDAQERRGFLARDMFGIKPLYYSIAGTTLVFASELRAVAASRLVSEELDRAALHGYFRHGSVAEPRTLLRDVRMLPAGATATWRAGRVTIHQPPPWPWGAPNHGDNHFAGRTRAALIESVGRHLSGDASVGVLLSGGMDSAGIVALAKAAGRDHLETFSLSFPGDAGDEGGEAKRSAAHFGVAHHVLPVDAQAARTALSDHLAAIDQPSIDGLNTFIAARFARGQGIKVLLSGIGADELFGGYASFWRVPELQRWHRVAAKTGPVASWIGASLQRITESAKGRRVGDLLEQTPSLEHAYDMFRGIFTRDESRRLVRYFTGGESPGDEDRQSPPQALDAVDAVGFLELTRYVRNQLLRDADVMGMASGVEVRTPYLDRELATVLWNIPSAERVRRGKPLLAAAVPEIPAWTMTGRKKCFQFPFEHWMQGEWRDVFRSVDASSPVPTGRWYRKWSLLSLEHSMRNLSEANRG